MARIDTTMLEGHFQTFISAIGVCILTWMGASLNDLQKNAATTAVDINYIKGEVENMKAVASKIYTTDSALVDWAESKQEFKDLRTRLRGLEIRIPNIQ